MKKLIFSLVIVFGITFFLNGCYTYLALDDDAKLADVVYEPYFPPTPPPPDPPGRPPRPHPPHPKPNPGYGTPVDNPPGDSYTRPPEVIDIRNGGEGRIPDQNDRRR